MSGAVTNPRVLRLVNADAVPASRPRHTPAHSEPIESENAAAASLDAADARWVLAVRTTMALEGGQAAILRPDARRTLVAMAMKMGLRTFDAALVIAIAQDAARMGEALSGPAQSRLSLVRPAASASSGNSFGPGTMFLISFFIAALFFVVMKSWLLP